MDAYLLTAHTLLAAATAGILAAAHLAGQQALTRARARTRRRELAAELEAAAAAYRPAPRRHNTHCPACGRFARHTRNDRRGTWTTCRVHGLKLRPNRLIGAAENPLLRIVTHVALDDLLPPVTGPITFVQASPARATDWLDIPTPRALPVLDQHQVPIVSAVS